MSLDDVIVSDIMVRDVITVNELASIQQACKLMSEHRIGSIIVVSDDGVRISKDTVPVGIITANDVVKQIGIDPYRSHYTVSEVLSSPLITIPPTTSSRYALRLMIGENIRRLPVVENGRLVGIVTDKDIYRAIVKSEALIGSLIEDELIIKHIEERSPWVYKLGAIGNKAPRNDVRSTEVTRSSA